VRRAPDARETASAPETPEEAPAPVVKTAEARKEPAPKTVAKRQVVKWAGVNASGDDLARLVRQRLNVEPRAVHTVGDLSGKGDQATLAALENDGQGEVLMVVESWEPPIADYVDFLSEMRRVVGRERMIVVLLYNRDAEGQPIPPRRQDVKVWRDQIATLGDPWLCVEELVEQKETLQIAK
jgi:hypothetical protein